MFYHTILIKALAGLLFFADAVQEPGRTSNTMTVTTDSLPFWVRADSAFLPLPPSMRVFTSVGLLDGAPNIAYYIEADLADRSLDFTTEAGYGKRHTPSNYFVQNDSPLVVVNGTFFSFADNRNLNLVIKNGQIIAHNPPAVARRGVDTFKYFYPFKGAIGINRQRKPDIAWVFSDTGNRSPMVIQSHPVRFSGTSPDPSIAEIKKIVSTSNTSIKKWRKIETAIGGGPVLVQNNKVHITNEEEMQFNGKAINDKHPRTAMGYTKDGKLIILVIQGRLPGVAEGATLEQEARMLQRIGCYEALNLDGGGSSCLLVNGKETIRPSDKEGQRPVPAVFMIRGK